MNNVFLIGRLTRDVELKYTAKDNQPIAKFTLAVNRVGEGADFIPITVYGKSAENCEKYLHKGSSAAVSGRITTGSYTNKNNVKVYTTDVVAANVEFLSRDNNNGTATPTAPAPAPKVYDVPNDFVPFDADDIPF